MSVRTIWGPMLLIVAVAVSPAAARGPEPEPVDEAVPELRQALREHFRNRLRRDLALTDQQMADVWPKVERLEHERRRLRREREQALRELRRGYREGASDKRLQELLDRVDAIQSRAHDLELDSQREIEAGLTVRQRVQLRFFVARFRQELQRRLQETRHDRLGGERPRPPRRPGRPAPGRRYP